MIKNIIKEVVKKVSKEVIKKGGGKVVKKAVEKGVFSSKDTGLKVLRQFNKLTKGKKSLPKSITKLESKELEYARDMLIKQGKGEEAILLNKELNKRAKMPLKDVRRANKEQGLTIRSQANEAIEIRRAEREAIKKEKLRLQDIKRKAGYQDTKNPSELMYGKRFADPNIAGKTKEQYIKERIKERKDILKGRGVKMSKEQAEMIKEEAEKHYDEAIKQKNKSWLELDKESSRETEAFADRYFKTSSNTEGREELSDLIKKMSPKQREDFMTELKSSEFKEDWDSGDDKGNSRYDQLSEYHTNIRLDKAITLARALIK